MTHQSRVGAALVLLAGLAPGSAPAAAATAQEHDPMLIDGIHSKIWPGQKEIEPAEYPQAQASFRADVAHYLKGRFQVTGDRLFVIPPDDGTRLSFPMFMLNGPGQFIDIHSAPALARRPYVVGIPDAASGAAFGNSILTLGVTLSGEPVYTAVGLYVLPDSKDELVGYFQLSPLVADPAKGL